VTQIRISHQRTPDLSGAIADLGHLTLDTMADSSPGVCPLNNTPIVDAASRRCPTEEHPHLRRGLGFSGGDTGASHGTVTGMRQLLPAPADPTAPVDLAALYAPPPGRSLRINFVSSLDGAAELDGRSGPLGGEPDKQVFHTLRSLCDIVLVGAGTARAENYGPVKVAGRAPEDQPPLALVSRLLNLPSTARFFTESGHRPLVITCAAATPPDWLRDAADLVVAGDEVVELGDALDQLAERGYRHVLCEGGPRLFADLAQSGLVDELCLTVAPVLAGPGRMGIIGGPAWEQPLDLELKSMVESDGVLLLRYAVTRNAASAR
jgi:riboflavin biosynthesis pyrimidine reductase